MKYNDMEPEQHLKFMFNAEIGTTGHKRYLKEDLDVYHKLNYNEPMPQNRAVRTENEIAVKMGEGDYKNFIYSYGEYLDLLYAAKTDPIAKDMFEKLIVYMALKY
jgi:hypothetical protein